MPKRVYLIRHGETEGTAEGRFLGSTDQPLSVHGRNQARRLARLLPGDLLASDASTWCVASPLLRARQTAEGVIGKAGHPVDIDPDLSEMDFGAWEGLTAEEIEERFPGELASWASPTDDTTFPGGESLREFDTRVARARERIVERRENTVVVFTHGGVVRGLICGLLGLGRESFWLFSVRPASVARIDLLGEGAVRGALLSGLWSADDWEVE